MSFKTIASISLVGTLSFVGVTQVNWDHVATGAAAGMAAKALANKAGSGTNVISTGKSGKEAVKAEEKAATKAETAKKVGKGVAGATLIGGLVIVGTQLAEPGFDKGVNDLGQKLDEPLNENDNNKRDAYCASMPSIQTTSGCK